MSDKVHTAPEDTPSVSDACRAISLVEDVFTVQVPWPDEWNRLDLNAELARIEANLRTWRSLAPTRLVKDHETLLAVLRRADSVIHAQAHDLARLRAELANLEENRPAPIVIQGSLRNRPTTLNPDEVLL